MKKALHLGLQLFFALMILCVLTSSCTQAGSKSPNRGRTKVTWMMAIDVVNKPMLDELVDRFNQTHPDIYLEMMWVPGGQQYHTKLKTLTAAGDPPDLFWSSDVHATYLLPSLADITELVERDREEIDLDDFYPELLEACKRLGGRYYYLPRYFNISLLYYNTKLFDEAGLSYPTEDWTWEDYIDAAKKLTKTDSKGKVIQWGSNVEYGWWGEWHILVQQAGGSFFSPDLKRCTLNTPEALTGLQFYYDKIFKYKIAPKPGYGPNRPVFASGVVAMDYGGHCGLWPSYRSVEGLRWDIQLLPRGPKTRVGGEVAVDCIGIAKDTKHLEAAWEVLKFIVSKESIRRHVKQGYLPVRKSVAAETILAGTPGSRPMDPQHTEVVYEALKYAKTIPRHPDYIEIALEIVQPEFDVMLLGDQTPEQAANRACKAVDKFITTLASERISRR